MTGGADAGAPPYGVYVHFPFCTHRCPYCDFAVSTGRPPEERRYLRAVLAELELRTLPGASRPAPPAEPSGPPPLAARGSAALRGFAAMRPVSLYVGGGTPSLWEPAEVALLISALRERLGLPAEAEVTIEANPESVDEARLAAWRAAGVNRISIGVQSFDPVVLRKLGRRHSAEAAARAVRLAAVAIPNISVDLIYGGRHSTVATARDDAARAADLGAVHVSAYALTLDRQALAEEVPFARLAREGKLAFPEEEESIAQARAVRGALRRAGLRRYEISNFARPGRESIHNGLYWSAASYLGLGAGAVGCRRDASGGLREANHRDWRTWIAAVEGGRLPTGEEDRFDPQANASERLMLGLRTVAGIPVEWIDPTRRHELAPLLRSRLAVIRSRRLVLTSRGMELHSAVAERLMR